MNYFLHLTLIVPYEKNTNQRITAFLQWKSISKLVINKNCVPVTFCTPFLREREKYGPLRENQIDTFLWGNSNLKSLASVKIIWLFRKMQKSVTIDEWYGTSSIISSSFLFGSGFAYLMFKQIDNNLTYYSIMHHHIRVFIYLQFYIWNQKYLV